MHKILIVAIACVATAFSQNVISMKPIYGDVKTHSIYQSTYDLTLASTSNAAILLSGGGAQVMYGVGIDFMATTLASTDIDIKLYPAPFWTNGTAYTKSPVWQPSYTTGTVVTGVSDPIDLNFATPVNVPQAIGTWIKSYGNSTFATPWTGCSNIGSMYNSWYAVAATLGTRSTVQAPAPYLMAPNSQHFLVLSNRTAAASNAVMRIYVQSYIPR